jgi:fatty-acyl-CoA synthase
MEDELAAADPAKPPAPGVEAKLIVLTSGTTGTPKGAPREQPKSLQPLGALLSKAPFRAGEATIVGTPLFHALGFAHAVVAIGLGSTLILRRRFDPEWAVDACEQYRATAIVVVPIMLRRLLDTEPDPARLRSLRIVFVAGSQLGGDLCRRAMAELGPIVYNLYGSTEVAYATIATPDELAAAPDSVGTPPRGTVVRLYDDDNRPIDTPGVTGRIFVGNTFQFEGYTGGGTKDVIDGLMSSGDVGHFDGAGRLYIDGRDDEMIVSGGENVFPAEVEELLTAHPDVVEAAAIGVDDEEFGQRLVAFVVPQDDAAVSEDELKAHVRHNLARYKVPREIAFVDELPRNPTGKVLKRELLAG